MSTKLTTAIWLGCLLGASAGQSTISPATTAPGGFKLPNLDVTWGALTYSGEVDFDHLGGGMSITEFDFISLLSKPITVAGDVMLVPAFQYGYTGLDFDGVSTPFPLPDEDLHSFGLHLAAIKLNEGSPWFYGGWACLELATDFEQLTSDAVTLDVAAGVGYRVNEQLTVAAGAAFLNFNGDFWVCPGINFDWVVNDQLRVGLYGPMPVIAYTPNSDWTVTLRGFPGGGIWNIESVQGASKSINLTSYQVGAFVGRRITGKLWFNAGVGLTTFNHLELTDPDGDHGILDQDLDWGLFGQIGLSLKAW